MYVALAHWFYNVLLCFVAILTALLMQGTKACLGWDREPQGGCHACTAVVDLWLQLLQRSLHLSHKLPQASRQV